MTADRHTDKTADNHTTHIWALVHTHTRTQRAPSAQESGRRQYIAGLKTEVETEAAAERLGQKQVRNRERETQLPTLSMFSSGVTSPESPGNTVGTPGAGGGGRINII